jgi:hypothetical protein
MKSINSRFFLVGAPRSGTTLLQSFLAAHSRINSFPETHFFIRIAGTDKSLIKYKIPFFNNLRYCRLKKKIGLGRCRLKCLKMRCLVKLFVHDLDCLTILKKKQVWIEKTPAHLHCIDLIQNNINNVRFIHIIRNGKDVVASLFKATNDYPLEWGGRKRSVEECVERWNLDVKLSEEYLIDNERHFIIKYEELVNNPEQELTKLFKWMKIDFEFDILDKYSIAASEIIGKDEKWKNNNFDRRIRKVSDTFETVFSLEQKEYINKNLHKSKFYSEKRI